jgi:hypothetical protein
VTSGFVPAIGFPGPEDVTRIIRPFGFYTSADYQLGRRWFAGGRLDRSERGACLPTLPLTIGDCNLPVGTLVQDTGGSLLLTYWPSEFSQIRGQLRRTTYQDTGGSLLLTYWPSEFSQIRGQLRRTTYAGRPTANEILFQLQFSMGAHGAHPF